MHIPKDYYNLPLRAIRIAVVEAESIINDLHKKGITDEDLSFGVHVLGRAARWIEADVVAAVAKVRTRKSATKTRRGGKKSTAPVPLQPSEQANG